MEHPVRTIVAGAALTTLLAAGATEFGLDHHQERRHAILPSEHIDPPDHSSIPAGGYLTSAIAFGTTSASVQVYRFRQNSGGAAIPST